MNSLQLVGKPEKKPIPESEMARANEMHNALVEIARKRRRFNGKIFRRNLSEEELAQGLNGALAKHDFFPVL